MREKANSFFGTVFADTVRKKVENLILILAGFGFIIHLLLIFLKELDLLKFKSSPKSSRYLQKT